jgi:hypothetical protein
MTQSISKSNAILAAKIGIQQIEVLQANNTISRMVRGAISARERIALLPINLASFERILEQMVLAYLDTGKVVVNRCPALLTNHHNAMTKILKSFILDSPSELQEANKKSIVARIFPGIPKDLVMNIIHGKSIPVKLLQKMQKNGLSTSSVAKLASIENDPIKKKQLVSQYFHKLKNSAYTLTRTNISEMTSLINKEVYGAIPRDLVGYQVHGIMDDRIRPEHRARNGTIYYRVPRYGNPGLDKMPNPPLEADGSHAWNCRCWIVPILSTDPKKFYDYKGRIIPDAKTFSNWFGASPKSKQVLAVGVRRHQEASKRLKPGETLQWHHLLDPKTGMLMDANEIRAETITKRSGRIRSIKSKITKIPT